MASSDPSDTDPVEAVRETVPWTKQLRKVVLLLLGSAAFGIFLYMMYLKTQGARIPYEDIFIVLGVSGALLGVNFGLDLFAGLTSEYVNVNIGPNTDTDSDDRDRGR
ncbi:hypothetical protein [Halococcus hamelinensis]|uniref:Uncharacterized protein n=1 Tax=Halococcus hamelinensis 100A6 TaxID=1132509 RepID=M0LXY9_9EURY|nr:hypothetical protein [Halococcus hamelinensis]EMA38457.1 hypothetical protein C447_09892 [Halococcus hamelinensis 100A6]